MDLSQITVSSLNTENFGILFTKPQHSWMGEFIAEHAK